MKFEHPATAILQRLCSLLQQERAALARLDRDEIERVTERKLELDEELKAAVCEHALQAEHRELLQKVREMGLENQLLLSHARSCVEGVLSLATPSAKPGYEPQHRNGGAPPPPVALNMRR